MCVINPLDVKTFAPVKSNVNSKLHHIVISTLKLKDSDRANLEPMIVGHIKHASWLQQLAQCWTRNSKPKCLELFATQCFKDWQKLGDNKSVTVLFFISQFLASVMYSFTN